MSSVLPGWPLPSNLWLLRVPAWFIRFSVQQALSARNLGSKLYLHVQLFGIPPRFWLQSAGNFRYTEAPYSLFLVLFNFNLELLLKTLLLLLLLSVIASIIVIGLLILLNSLFAGVKTPRITYTVFQKTGTLFIFAITLRVVDRSKNIWQ